jgi:hypothetical protein
LLAALILLVLDLLVSIKTVTIWSGDFFCCLPCSSQI